MDQSKLVALEEYAKAVVAQLRKLGVMVTTGVFLIDYSGEFGNLIFGATNINDVGPIRLQGLIHKASGEVEGRMYRPPIAVIPADDKMFQEFDSRFPGATAPTASFYERAPESLRDPNSVVITDGVIGWIYPAWNLAAL